MRDIVTLSNEHFTWATSGVIKLVELEVLAAADEFVLVPEEGGGVGFAWDDDLLNLLQ